MSDSDQPASERRVVVDDDDLRVTWVGPGGGLCVVAFAGVGYGMGGFQIEEFRNSLGRLGIPFATAFVIDKHRRWFNDGVAARVEAVLNPLLRETGASRVVTVGNSMGGTGALILAARLENCERALAFVPQSSAHPEITPFEKRYVEYRSAITVWDVADAAAELNDLVRYDIVVGEKFMDRKHAARFAVRPNVTVHTVAGCGHNVAAYLKAEGRLEEVLRSALMGEPISVGSLLPP